MRLFLVMNEKLMYRSSHQRCSIGIGVLKNFKKFTGKHLYQSLIFNKVAGPCNFIKKEALAQVFSCEFCEIFKNTFFTEHLRTTASRCKQREKKNKIKYIRCKQRDEKNLKSTYCLSQKIASQDKYCFL